MKKFFLTIAVALIFFCQAYAQTAYKGFDTVNTSIQLPFTTEGLHTHFQDSTQSNGLYQYWARFRNIDWGDTLVTTIYAIKVDTTEIYWDTVSQSYQATYDYFVDFDSVVNVIYTPRSYGTPQVNFWADTNGDINIRINALRSEVKLFWQVNVP
jgi:hypothetical protein